jgi:hypothetical protein
VKEKGDSSDQRTETDYNINSIPTDINKDSTPEIKMLSPAVPQDRLI